MTMRSRALILPKPLATLAFLSLIAAASLAFAALTPRVEPFAPAALDDRMASEADGELVTGTKLPLNLPVGRVYDRLTVQVLGAEPSTRNGKTGQMAMFVLLFTFLSAVTLVFWRHHRRDYASPRRIGRRI
jgi:hypothetical protein